MVQFLMFFGRNLSILGEISYNFGSPKVKEKDFESDFFIIFSWRESDWKLTAM